MHAQFSHGAAHLAEQTCMLAGFTHALLLVLGLSVQQSASDLVQFSLLFFSNARPTQRRLLWRSCFRVIMYFIAVGL